MRLWSLHPRYLDVKGLLAVWREGLLARAVLLEQTKGYQNHPQLTRFKAQPDPVAAINYYLEIVAEEGTQRGYHLNIAKITCGLHPPQITVTDAQVQFEKTHLQKKLQQRDPSRLALLTQSNIPELHPLFVMIPGPMEPWEKI
jgi:hypothetical protein